MSKTNWIQRILARLGAPAGASVSADIAAVDTVVDAIKTVTDALPNAGALNDLATILTAIQNATYGLSALETLVDELETRLSAVRAGYLDELDFDLQGLLNTIAAYLTTEIADILTDTGATIPGTITTLQAAVDAIQVDLGDFSAQANLQTLLAALGIPDVSGKPLYTLLVTDRLDHGTYGLNALKTLIEAISTATPIAATDAGVAQIAPTTIDLNQAAATYDLFTGIAQVVILESLNIKMPNIVAGGALTSVSIQTDDVTPGVIISAADGGVANLTAEADLGWTGTLYITVGTKIRLTIAGGAHGIAYVCQVTAKCRAVVDGGNLA